MSYANLSLYSAAMPSYNPKKEDEDEFMADDPENEERLNQFIKQLKD